MANKEKFEAEIRNGYSFKGEAFKIGRAVFDGAISEGADIYIPLKTMNRHGLIAGATGTGKTKTLQVLAEGLSEQSVSVLLLDIKGDLSGIAATGTINDKISERIQLLSIDYNPSAYPAELLTLSNQ